MDGLLVVNSKTRYEFVDLAKGICILLVVFSHNVTAFHGPLSDMLRSFRMPLYFLLSGMFFSKYGGLAVFCVKKINKLLVPFIAFEIIASFVARIAVGKNIDFDFFSKCWNENLCNYPIWFLLCLFTCGIVFYLIVLVSENIHFVPQYVSLLVLSLGIGSVGFFCGKSEICVPCYIDSALTALPFYAMGFCMRKYTGFLQSSRLKKWYIPLALILFIITIFSSYSHLVDNDMTQTSMWQFYLLGLSGTLSVLIFAKYFCKMPFISFWGRYSICILVTHAFLFNYLLLPASNYISNTYGIEVHLVRILTFLILMFSYQLLIPLMLKYLPHLCAQKDIIVCKNKSEHFL